MNTKLMRSLTIPPEIWMKMNRLLWYADLVWTHSYILYFEFHLFIFLQEPITMFDVVSFDFLEGAKTHSVKDQMKKVCQIHIVLHE